ncbi:MAG: hypothetical protein ABI560_14910, partial [Myxococcales bacterium]
PSADGWRRSENVVPTEEQQRRLDNIIGWLQTAKETLPAIHDGGVSADRVAHMSALLDRLYTGAAALRDRADAARDDRAA